MHGQNRTEELSPIDNFDMYLTDYHDQDLDEVIWLPIITEEEEEDTNEEMIVEETIIPTTNSDQTPLEVNEDVFASEAFRDMVVSGNILLNKCGTLLVRSRHQIKGSLKHILFSKG